MQPFFIHPVPSSRQTDVYKINHSASNQNQKTSIEKHNRHAYLIKSYEH